MCLWRKVDVKKMSAFLTSIFVLVPFTEFPKGCRRTVRRIRFNLIRIDQSFFFVIPKEKVFLINMRDVMVVINII